MATRRRYTRELLADAVAASTSMAAVMRLLGVIPAGGTHAHLSRTVKQFGIDTSHFRRGLPIAEHHARKRPDQIFVRLPAGARRAGPRMLSRGLIESGVPYACAVCSCDGTWQGLPLTLEVDHIDGDYRNNVLSNLRFLCPNCHRQTPNFAGRSRGKFSGHATAVRAQGARS
jgi:hypothetical protein